MDCDQATLDSAIADYDHAAVLRDHRLSQIRAERDRRIPVNEIQQAIRRHALGRFNKLSDWNVYIEGDRNTVGLEDIPDVAADDLSKLDDPDEIKAYEPPWPTPPE